MLWMMMLLLLLYLYPFLSRVGRKIETDFVMDLSLLRFVVLCCVAMRQGWIVLFLDCPAHQLCLVVLEVVAVGGMFCDVE